MPYSILPHVHRPYQQKVHQREEAVSTAANSSPPILVGTNGLFVLKFSHVLQLRPLLCSRCCMQPSFDDDRRPIVEVPELFARVLLQTKTTQNDKRLDFVFIRTTFHSACFAHKFESLFSHSICSTFFAFASTRLTNCLLFLFGNHSTIKIAA